MKIADVTRFLESIAPTSLQESYDNAGLITGNTGMDCTGILISLDATEEVIMEAVNRRCNLVVAHHPVIFKGLKKITGKTYVERTVIAAIKNDIAIYAIHTNLDNVLHGVNGKIASILGLRNITVLSSRQDTLKKLFTFVPVNKLDTVRDAIFEAGGGVIGKYSECSFNVTGTGTFKAGAGTNPYVGKQGERHEEEEIKAEIVFPAYLEKMIVTALKQSHPYEEVAFDIVALSNPHPAVGAGLVGELQETVSEKEFLGLIKTAFRVPMVRYTELTGKPVKRVAVCGGAGSFLVFNALAAGVDFYITADMKYHEFFDAEGKLVIADVGHYESEQFTIDLLQELLVEKFPTFAVLKTAVETNPVKYF
ncbi:MAG: Nif3-like dinuclear metal center hexameric protein [Bacteroidetes bacterium]|nr:Nif3-like dinuclear metal center hexameric protein [Bacteroidota bacterium]